MRLMRDADARAVPCLRRVSMPDYDARRYVYFALRCRREAMPQSERAAR